MELLEQINKKIQELYTERLLTSSSSIYDSISPFFKLGGLISGLILINYHPLTFIGALFLFFEFGILLLFEKLSLKYYLKGILVVGLVIPTIIVIPRIIQEIIFLSSQNMDFSELLIFLHTRINTTQYEGIGFLFRILANTTIIFFFTSITPFTQILHVCNRIHLSPIFLINLFLTYRYFFLYFEILTHMVRADASRRSIEYPMKQRFNHYGTMFGMLFLRTIKQGQMTYMAMITRGFEGQIPDICPEKINGRSILFLVGICVNYIILFF